MKIKRTVKESFLDIPLKYAGEVTFIGEESMERVIRGTRWGFEDTKEVDPETKTVANPQGRMRPFGSIVGWRTLKETGKLETFCATYELQPD